MNSQKDKRQALSPSKALSFDVVTPDFIDHVIYKAATSARERDVDPRHSVVIRELWEFRLSLIARTMIKFNDQADSINVAMDNIDHARLRLGGIYNEISEGAEDTRLRELVVEAYELLGSLELSMEEADNGR